MFSFSRFFYLSLFFCLPSILFGVNTSHDIEFKSDFYQRDLHTDTIKGKGHAWLRKEGREIWADEIEVDFTIKRAIANGNVHIREGGTDVWCRHLSYNIDGDDAVMEDATVSIGQLVMLGATIRRLTKTKFDIEEGSYTNCNVDQLKQKDIDKCMYDWKIYGHHMSVTVEKYAYVTDAIFYVKQLPVLYTPYFIAPVQTQRQSGFLMPKLSFNQDLGSGVELPYFWALAPWQDLLIDPTYYSTTGYHVGLNYRYNYSEKKRGDFNFYFLQRRFSDNLTDPSQSDISKPKALGIIGEWAVTARNIYSFKGRGHSNQTIRLVSHPLYSYDYSGDLGIPSPDVAALRSQVSFTFPGDNSLFTAQAQHYQSLIISRDGGVDRGAVTQLPSVSYSRTTTPFWSKYFSYELDTTVTNFWRPTYAYDNGPVNADPTTNYQLGNFIRTGRRMQLEPRLVINLPIANGLQFQPLIRAGTLIYNFDVPSPTVLHREYADYELPISLYLTKGFTTGISGYENLKHIFQPRFVYARRPFITSPPNHPFFNDPFLVAPNGLGPQFDSLDQPFSHEYMRFELINRVLRKVNNGMERFFLLQVSEQYNLRTTPDDLRYTKHVGPIELLSEFSLWRFTGQLQATYNLETTQPPNDPNAAPVNEYSWSSTVAYRSPNTDMIALSTRFAITADPTQMQKQAYIDWYKTLPFFFDINGHVEYSILNNDLGAYNLGLMFSSKPRSCWAVVFSAGRNPSKVPFASVDFKLNFGSPSSGINPV